jgi:hypothetical protein
LTTARTTHMINLDVGLVGSFLRVPGADSDCNGEKSSKNSVERSSTEYELKPSLKIELRPQSTFSPERKLLLTRQVPLKRHTDEKERRPEAQTPNGERGLQIELPELEFLVTKKHEISKKAKKSQMSNATPTESHSARLFHSQIVPQTMTHSDKKITRDAPRSLLVLPDDRKDRSQDPKIKSFNEETKPNKANALNFSSSFKQISDRVKHNASPIKANHSNSIERLKLMTKMDFYRSQKTFTKPDHPTDSKQVKPTLKNPVNPILPTVTNHTGSQRNSANEEIKPAMEKFKLANVKMFKRSFESDTNSLVFAKRKISSEIKSKVSLVETGMLFPEKPINPN